MKCKRCGNEMKIKPVELGKDKQVDPIYHTYAFCYDCKVKVDLDKQREQRTSDPDRERCVKTKKNKKKGGSISLKWAKINRAIRFIIHMRSATTVK